MIASVAHYSIFPYIEWNPQYKHEKVKGILLRDTLALRDFVTDMQVPMSLRIFYDTAYTSLSYFSDVYICCAAITTPLYTQSQSHHNLTHLIPP